MSEERSKDAWKKRKKKEKDEGVKEKKMKNK